MLALLFATVVALNLDVPAREPQMAVSGATVVADFRAGEGDLLQRIAGFGEDLCAADKGG
jgi:hypothetical protein